jgi:hypothetical protein
MAYQTNNFFNQTMTQMNQGKSTELQPLVNKRQTRGMSPHSFGQQQFAPANIEMYDAQSIITTVEPLKKDEEMQNDFSADIKMKVRGNQKSPRPDFSVERTSVFDGNF